MVGGSRNPDMGLVVWCGDCAGVRDFERRQRVRAVVVCDPGNFAQVLKDNVWVVAVVFAGHHIDTVKMLSTYNRRYCYEVGIAVPVYACTASREMEAFQCGMDVVVGVNDWQGLAEKLQFKLTPREPQVNIVWCDPLASSPIMAAMVEPLSKLGLNVELVEDAQILLDRVDETVAAVITSARGIPMLSSIREKLHEECCRPLFWVVSLSAKAADCYASGADAAIVCDNDVLQAQSKHLREMDPNRPWMWNVVVGDLLAHLQATGVARLGGVQWSLPKRFDDLQWRAENFEMLFKRGSCVFQQLALECRLRIVKMHPNEHAASFEDRFQRSRRALKGYVRDRIVYHGTSEEAAMKIVQTGIIPSSEGMYGPGAYFVDPVGLRKALFFALTATNRRDPSARGSRSHRSSGAIIAFRVAMCETQIVTELPQGTWYGRRTPCADGQESVIGVHSGGYRGCGSRAHCTDEALNDIAEYVCRSTDLVVPIGIAIFKCS